MTLADVFSGAAQRDALIQGAVVADLGGFADHDTHSVIDKETFADGGARVDLDPGQPTRPLTDQPRGEIVTAQIQFVGDAVGQDGMHARIQEQHLHIATGGRIALPHGVNVTADFLQDLRGQTAQIPEGMGYHTAGISGDTGGFFQ